MGTGRRRRGTVPRAGSAGAFAAPPADRAAGKRPSGGSPETVGFLILDDEPDGPSPAAGRTAAPSAAGSHGAAGTRLAQPEPADDREAWFYADAGTPQGPVGLSELKALARDGRINAEALYSHHGLDQWTAGTALPELARIWTPAADSSPAAGAVTLPPRSRPDDAGLAGAVVPLEMLAAFSLLLNLICGIGNLAAIVVGALALRRVARSNGTLRGREIALAGMALGLVGLLATAIVAYRYFAHPDAGLSRN